MTRDDIKGFFPDHPDVVNLLVDVWLVMQAWDDAFDGDPADHHEGYKTALIRFPENPAYNQYCVHFLIAQCYYDWMTANEFEKYAIELDKAYMLRAGFFRIVISLIHLVRGSEAAEKEAPVIWRMYTEDFIEYRQEIEHHAKNGKKQSGARTEEGATGTTRSIKGDL